MAKANRALEHATSLTKLVKDFRDSEPYEVTPEPTEKRGRTAYRLRIHRDPPVAVSATIGDVLHNQRAALDNLAFELARRSHDGQLTPAQEHDSAFPICKDPGAFDEFKAKKDALYDATAYAAMRSAQPFVILEGAHSHGISLDQTFDEEFRNSILYRLNRLWNIDKHRRLTVMGPWLDMFYWGSDGESKRRAYRGDGTMAHDSILYYMEGTDEGVGDEIINEFNLALTDDPAFSRDGNGATGDVVKLLQGFQQHLSYVFGCVFTAMS